MKIEGDCLCGKVREAAVPEDARITPGPVMMTARQLYVERR